MLVVQKFGGTSVGDIARIKNVAKKVYDDSELNSFIRSELTDDAETKNIYVKRYCKEINWIIQQLNEKKQQNEPVHSMRFREVHVAEKNNHIMISYNRNSRDLCLKIKTELENAGHSVWIDIESIHGSSLESMANAIEESKCVLICMTENYKQSVNCRAVSFCFLKHYSLFKKN